MFKRFYLLVVFFGFIILIPSIFYTISSISFKMDNFISAKKIADFSLEYIKDKKNYLHLGNYYYKIGNYSKALEKYSNYECVLDSECFVYHHNLGNTYYKVSYDYSDLEQKINILVNSLHSYLVALNIKESSKTKHNYEYVLQKLIDLLEENGYDIDDFFDNDKTLDNLEDEIYEESDSGDDDSFQEQEEFGEEGEDMEEDMFQEEGDEDELGDESNTEAQQRQPSMGLGGEESEALVPLSNEEQKYLENYIENLQREEKGNRRLNMPNRRNSIFRGIDLDEFFNNSSDW